VQRRPRRYVTLEGYAVEGGFDGPYQPSTCFRPTIALGRHAGPAGADDLWRDYEAVLDLVPGIGFDGVRLNVEWARVEPHRGVVDEVALERYAEVASYAQNLGLGVTVVIVDAAWPAWLGLEAWLLPWVVPCVLEQAARVVGAVRAATGVVVFSDPEYQVNGFLDSSAPPWRRNARRDAEMAHDQINSILTTLRGDALVGPKVVASSAHVRVDQSDSRRTGDAVR
jgi:beta-glucosidase/6-phospho-beta-glucosidase/beta-galactosidase